MSVNIRLDGSRTEDGKYSWTASAIVDDEVRDFRGEGRRTTHATTGGIANTEAQAKADMVAAIVELINGLQFGQVQLVGDEPEVSS